MSKKVPDALRKALYRYIEKPDEEIIESLLKSCFPDEKVYNKGKRNNLPKR